MSDNAKTPDNHHEAASADKPLPELPEENSGASDASVSNANADVQRDGDQAPPTEQSIEPAIEAQSP